MTATINIGDHIHYMGENYRYVATRASGVFLKSESGALVSVPSPIPQAEKIQDIGISAAIPIIDAPSELFVWGSDTTNSGCWGNIPYVTKAIGEMRRKFDAQIHEWQRSVSANARAEIDRLYGGDYRTIPFMRAITFSIIDGTWSVRDPSEPPKSGEQIVQWEPWRTPLADRFKPSDMVIIDRDPKFIARVVGYAPTGMAVMKANSTIGIFSEEQHHFEHAAPDNVFPSLAQPSHLTCELMWTEQTEESFNEGYLRCMFDAVTLHGGTDWGFFEKLDRLYSEIFDLPIERACLLETTDTGIVEHPLDPHTETLLRLSGKTIIKWDPSDYPIPDGSLPPMMNDLAGEIVTNGDQAVDGFHRIDAAIKSNTPLMYVDWEDLD